MEISNFTKSSSSHIQYNLHLNIIAEAHWSNPPVGLSHFIRTNPKSHP